MKRRTKARIQDGIMIAMVSLSWAAAGAMITLAAMTAWSRPC